MCDRAIDAKTLTEQDIDIDMALLYYFSRKDINRMNDEEKISAFLEKKEEEALKGDERTTGETELFAEFKDILSGKNLAQYFNHRLCMRFDRVMKDISFNNLVENVQKLYNDI